MRYRPRPAIYHRLRHVLIAGLIGVLLILSCGRDPAHWGKVVRVRDGDTVELEDGRVIRYAGIDTPEVGEPGADSATVMNTAMVLNKPVRLEFGEDRIDRYNRVVAFVFVDDRMVNMELLKAGWAWCYFFRGNLQFGNQMVLAVQQAMTNKRGLWGTPRVNDEPVYIGSTRGFRFHRPGCPSVDQIKVGDVREFPVVDSALSSGYSPCKGCRPYTPHLSL